MNPNIPNDPVFGLEGVAQMMGTTKGALSARRHRGKLDLTPLAHVGRTEVYSQAQVRAYMAQQAGQSGKAAH